MIGHSNANNRNIDGLFGLQIVDFHLHSYKFNVAQCLHFGI